MTPEEARQELRNALHDGDWIPGDIVSVPAEALDTALGFVPEGLDGLVTRVVYAPDHGDPELTAIALLDRVLGTLSDPAAADRVLDYVQRRRTDISLSLATALPPPEGRL